MNFQCTTAALTRPLAPDGLRHLVLTRPGAKPSMRFLSVGSPLCTRASSRHPLAGCPCRRRVVISVPKDTIGTPTGDFHPISSCPCRAYTSRWSGRLTARFLRCRAGRAPSSAAQLSVRRGECEQSIQNEILVKIQINPHTLERAEERGTTKEEIIDVIKSGIPVPAKRGKMGSAKVFPYNQNRGRKFYEQKRVEVIYVTEPDVVVTVTVYVFYGKWES
jgi:hypothetical protein